MQTIIQIIADGLVIPIALIGAGVLLWRVPSGQRLMVYSHIILAGLTAYVLAKVVGLLYQPASERPFEIMGVDPGASFLNNPGFPSDHALFVMAIAFAVLCTVRPRWIGWILVGLAILVCLGRVLALVHTPLDVIGGTVIAAIGAMWYLHLPRKKQQTASAKRP